MVIYYSGTGNSRYVAIRIAKVLGDDAVDLFDRIKNHDYSDVYSEKSWIVVSPTYAYRMPRIVSEWIKNANLEGNKNIYYILTCGDLVGKAGEYAKKISKRKGMYYKGLIKVVMPENYIALYNVPNEEEAIQIIRKADTLIDGISDSIKKGEDLDSEKEKWAWFNSHIVNPVFYKFTVSDRDFHVVDACIGCGKCVNRCPLSNIVLIEGKPKWGGNCTHCMACICNCPKDAIEYGETSVGKPRYRCPIGNI